MDLVNHRFDSSRDYTALARVNRRLGSCSAQVMQSYPVTLNRITELARPIVI